jgi:gentisate 1,2-dioxygenase
MGSNIKAFETAANMDELLALLQRAQVVPGWAKKEPSLYPKPHEAFVPAHWSYEMGKAALDCAGRYVNTEHAERRNLILYNPVEGNNYASVKSLVAAYQMVLAGEVAVSHRHSPNALRLVMDTGPKAYTVVDGKKIPMLPGDVLLTPNWSWHGHANESDRPAYWIDFLDVPLVHLLDPMFFEPWKGGLQQTALVDERSPMRFPYEYTKARLEQASESAPGERVIELGPPKIDTIALYVSRLDAGKKADLGRTTANSIFAAIEGRGSSTVGDTEIEWSRGDVFTVPSWRRHEYRAHERSYLLRVTDEPVLRLFNWLRKG